MSWRALIVFGSLLWMVDILVKAAIHTSLPLMTHSAPYYPYGGIPVFQNFYGLEFSITHHTNSGAAWGLFAAYPGILLAVRILLITGLIVFALVRRARGAGRLGVVLVTLGAVANVLDHLLYGHVVDMFHFILWGYDYPVFNLADSYICLGVAVLILFGKTDVEVQHAR